MVARNVAGRISESINSKVTVGKVRYRVNNSLIIRNLLVRDDLNDTAAFIKRLELHIKDLDLNSRRIHINKAKIIEPYTNIYFKANDSINISNLLAEIKQSETKKFDWKIKCKELSITKSRNKYHSLDNDSIVIDNFSSFASNIVIDSNEIQLRSDYLFFNLNQEPFVSDLRFNLSVSNNQYSIDSLNLQTNNSTLQVIKARFVNKENKWEGEANISPSKINLSDFTYLLPSLSNFQKDFNVSGNFNFDNQTITGNKLKFFIGKESSIMANFRLLNFTNKKNIAYFVNFENAFTNSADIAYIAQNYLGTDSLNLPKQLDALGGISYQGSIQGSIDSIKSNGTFYSDAGIIKSKITLKQDNNSESILINGGLQTLPFYVNKITNDDSFGELKLDINTDGYYSKSEGINLKLDGYINHIDLKISDLDSIHISGHFKNDYFNGRISSYDPDLRADFEGEILIGKEQSYNFKSNIYYANLHAMGLSNNDSVANISVNISANLKGKNLENSVGKLIVSDLFYFQDSTYIATDSITVISEHYNNEKHLSLRSEFIDIDFNGVYYIPTLISDLELFAQKHSPSLFNDIDTTNQKLNNFRFKILAKYPHPLTDNFINELRIASGTEIEGEFSAIQNNLTFTCYADKIEYNDRNITDLRLKSYTKKDQFNINIESKEFNYSENNSLKNLLLSFSIKNDTIKNNINWNNWLDKNYSGNINSNIVILPGFTTLQPKLKLLLAPSNIIIIDTVWTLNQCSITKDSSGILFENFKIGKGNSEFRANGKISDNKADSIILGFSNVNLYNLNILLKKKNLNFGGILNGETIIKDIYKDRIIDSDFEILNFTLNDEYVGNTILRSNWNKELQQLEISGLSKQNDATTFNFEGYIATARQDMSIDINFNDQNMELLEAFLKPTLDNISGKLSGSVNIYGHPKSPSWKGNIYVDNVKVTVVPTNSTYNFSDSLSFHENKIFFNEIQLYDTDSNIAVLNGTISNVDLKDFSIDFLINTNRFLGLNTQAKHHPYYYGKVYGKGIIGITGPTRDIRIDISASTLNNSTIYIPLAGRSDIKENDFITFVDKSKIEVSSRNQDEQKDQSNNIKAKTTINIDMEITPLTEIQILFDPKIGDLLKARGTAQINIESKPNDFGIYGDFIIDQGDFLFTLQDVLNKKLEIVQGSSVSWTGHPVEADINLDAIYKVRRASIQDLTQDSTDRGKRIPVDCHMLMTNKLTNPDIKFKIEVTSNSDNIVIEQLNSLPEEEISKQVLSLMILNKFAPLTTANSGLETSNTASLGATTVSELLSNQLSYWMSQINSDFDLGFTYRPGVGDIQNEYELAMSTTLWEERITVYGNLGYGGQNTQDVNPNSPYTTEFMIELKVNKKGNVRLRAFNKENDDIDNLDPAAYKQGVGVFYTEEFDNFSQLMQRMFRKDVATKPDEIEEEKEENIPDT